MNDIVGKRFESKNSGWFTVLRKTSEKYKRALLYEIVFDEVNKVKYKTLARKENINRGAVKNPYYPSVYGIGYLGNATRKENEIVYIRWKAMLGRCYSPKNRAYKFYGYRSVTVCDRWLCLGNFFEDFKLLDGYDENNLSNLHLDKDIKIPGNKIYSPDACILVSVEENLIEMKKRTKQN